MGTASAMLGVVEDGNLPETPRVPGGCGNLGEALDMMEILAFPAAVTCGDGPRDLNAWTHHQESVWYLR